MEDVLGALVPIVFVIAIAATMILRPLAKRLGDVVDMYHREKLARGQEARDERRLEDALASLDRRLELIEQRVDFQESLLGERRPEARSRLGRVAD